MNIFASYYFETFFFISDIYLLIFLVVIILYINIFPFHQMLLIPLLTQLLFVYIFLLRS